METQTDPRQVTIYVDREIIKPDNDQWTNRFEIHSETSDRIYTIAQNKRHRHWACSCMAWKRYRHCKHLDAVGVPNYERPYEAKIQGR
jgi:hypothetical protein